MNILVAPDSFKGSLTALQAADAIVQGVRDVLPDAEIVSIPLADGGEGTVDALVMATGGRILREKVTGPMGDPVEIKIRGYNLTLRKNEADQILVQTKP